MRWRALFDPWKIPTYIAGIAVGGFFGFMAYEARNHCGIDCKLDRIGDTLARIETKLDQARERIDIMGDRVCRGTNWNLPYIPSQRDI